MEKENMQELSEETLKNVTGGAIPIFTTQLEKSKDQLNADLMNDGKKIETLKEKY